MRKILTVQLAHPTFNDGYTRRCGSSEHGTVCVSTTGKLVLHVLSNFRLANSRRHFQTWAAAAHLQHLTSPSEMTTSIFQELNKFILPRGFIRVCCPLSDLDLIQS
jgi:hypothetical protein